MEIFALGAQAAMSKIAADNPTAPRLAPYLNQGGGQAGQQQPGAVAKQPQPHPGYVTAGTGVQQASPQVAGDLKPHGAPDQGERGAQGGDMTVTKSAALAAGFDAAMAKIALSPETAHALAPLTGQVVGQTIGGLVGHHYGRKQKERGEEHTFGAPQVAGALLLPGGLGYQIGRFMAHRNKNIETKK